MIRRSRSITRGAFAVALFACLAGGAHARNDRLVLPIQAALEAKGSPYAIDPAIPVRFGSDSAAGVDPKTPIAQVQGTARPFSAADPNAGGRTGRLDDGSTCIEAFRRAVQLLQQDAKVYQAHAVVGVVSTTIGELDSTDSYVCRVGQTRAVVDLRGRAVKTR